MMSLLFKVCQHGITSRMALPTPLRGGVAKGRGGVCVFFVDCMLQTPPLPLPLRVGELLRLVFFLYFSYSDF